MRTDGDIERDVKEELKWGPDLDASDIAVSVKDGVVTLAGFVKSFTDKYEAEAAAKRVAGVSAVANDLEVRLPAFDQRPDPDIARDAVAAIKSQLPISSEHIKIVVKNGWVALEGTAEWQYQRSTAETAVRRIVDRTRGSRTRRLGSPRSDQGGRPHRGEPIGSAHPRHRRERAKLASADPLQQRNGDMSWHLCR